MEFEGHAADDEAEQADFESGELTEKKAFVAQREIGAQGRFAAEHR